MSSTGRIKKEIEDLKRDASSGIKVESDPSDPNHLKGSLKGPPDTPYHNGTFEVDIIIPTEYPFTPPKMKFLTKLWHPNVSSVTGAICLDILKDQWSPALTMKTVMLSLQALMCAPVPDDPQVFHSFSIIDKCTYIVSLCTYLISYFCVLTTDLITYSDFLMTMMITGCRSSEYVFGKL